MHGWCGWYDGMIDVDVLERISSIEFYLWGVLKLVGIVPFGSTGAGVLYIVNWGGGLLLCLLYLGLMGNGYSIYAFGCC